MKTSTLNQHPTVIKMMPDHQAEIVKSSWVLKKLMCDLEKDLAKIPNLYAQDGLGKHCIVYAHYFYGSSHWFITEWDKDDLFFGYAVLNNDIEMAEFGYMSLAELRQFPIELDFYWTPKTLKEALEERNLL